MARARTNTQDNRYYLAIFTRKLLRILALVSITFAAILLGIGLFNPNYFEIDIARFILCTGIATSLSIFFFVFYPQAIEMNINPIIGVPLRVVGPIVLWFAVLLFLWEWMPTPKYGRLFRPVKNGQPGGMYYGGSDSTKLWCPDGSNIKYLLIPNMEDRGLNGIYIEFEKNVNTYKAKLQHTPYKAIDVEFSRQGPDTFEISSFQPEENR